MRLSRSALGAFLGLACLVAGSAAHAADEGSGSAASPGNVSLTIVVGEATKGAERTYRLVTTYGATARMLVGWRTPIPTVRTPEDGGEPVTSYVYQNVGMTVRLRASHMDKGRIPLEGEIELSGSRESEMKENVAGMPMIGTFQQEVNALFEPGKALRIAEAPDPAGGQRYLEITVTPMK
jgi:hypothetical protein